jgi:hypothetical protein
MTPLTNPPASVLHPTSRLNQKIENFENSELTPYRELEACGGMCVVGACGVVQSAGLQHPPNACMLLQRLRRRQGGRACNCRPMYTTR